MTLAPKQLLMYWWRWTCKWPYNIRQKKEVSTTCSSHKVIFVFRSIALLRPFKMSFFFFFFFCFCKEPALCPWLMLRSSLMLLDLPLLPVPLSTASRPVAWPCLLLFVKAEYENESDVGMTGSKSEAWICAFKNPHSLHLFALLRCLSHPYLLVTGIFPRLRLEVLCFLYLASHEKRYLYSFYYVLKTVLTIRFLCPL